MPVDIAVMMKDIKPAPDESYDYDFYPCCRTETEVASKDLLLF
ncbi:MAG: hypothetical protein OQJ78_10930 [Ignavibacteriaceae bacterium]|jgi:hypothetical protein|nr:hypothetical protein [Ignavibacteriaceae bacterium]